MSSILTPPFIAPSSSGGNCGYYADYFADIYYHGNWVNPVFPFQSFAQWQQNTLPQLAASQPRYWAGATGVRRRYREVLKFPSGTGFNYTPYEYDNTYEDGYEKRWWNNTPNTHFNVFISSKRGWGGPLEAFITSDLGASISVSYHVNYYAVSGFGHPYPSTCPPLDFFRLPQPPKIYFGNAAPPPPPPKNMNCCDCNTIATIVENQSLQQLRAQEKLFEQLKDHIDRRALEIIMKDLEHLKALNFEEFLKAVIKRINEVESNLWNGPKQ